MITTGTRNLKLNKSLEQTSVTNIGSGYGNEGQDKMNLTYLQNSSLSFLLNKGTSELKNSTLGTIPRNQKMSMTTRKPHQSQQKQASSFFETFQKMQSINERLGNKGVQQVQPKTNLKYPGASSITVDKLSQT